MCRNLKKDIYGLITLKCQEDEEELEINGQWGKEEPVENVHIQCILQRQRELMV